ncbi:type II toxin-antitoxin system RelE/ParE family toxin, partial [Candidatus Omnitrophota bacterium]
AHAVVSKIFDKSRYIREFPFIGRIVPEIGDKKIREHFVYSYRLVYKVEEKRILVIAVIHDKRLFESISDHL